MSKELAKVETFDLTKISDLPPAQQQEVLSSQLFGSEAAAQVEYTAYGKKCAVNAIVATQSYLKANNKSFKDVDANLFLLSLHSIAVSEINCAAMPSEAYIELRGNVLAIKPQGAGNESLVRRFGVGIKPQTGLHKAWLVREGDEFEFPCFDGLNSVPPKWRPKSFTKKVIRVVYPVEKTDGTVEYLIAERDSVISNVVAQLRQTLLYAFVKRDPQTNAPLKDRWGKTVIDAKARDEAYERINKLAENAKSLDDFLSNPDISKYLNPTYTSFGSREAMIVRKMQNNALKQYPKDYESSAAARAMKLLDEDYDGTTDEPPQAFRKESKEDVVATVEREIAAPQSGPVVQAFDVDENGEVKASGKTPEAEEPAPSAKKADYSDLE